MEDPIPGGGRSYSDFRGFAAPFTMVGVTFPLCPIAVGRIGGPPAKGRTHAMMETA